MPTRRPALGASGPSVSVLVFPALGRPYRLPEHSTGLAGLAAALTAHAVDQSFDRDAVEVTVFAAGGHRGRRRECSGRVASWGRRPGPCPPELHRSAAATAHSPRGERRSPTCGAWATRPGPCPAALHSSG